MGTTSVSVTDEGEVKLSGSLNGRIGVGFSGTVGVSVEAGQIELDIRGISVGFVPMPGAVGDQVEPLVNDVLDINQSLQGAGGRYNGCWWSRASSPSSAFSRPERQSPNWRRTTC